MSRSPRRPGSACNGPMQRSQRAAMLRHGPKRRASARSCQWTPGRCQAAGVSPRAQGEPHVLCRGLQQGLDHGPGVVTGGARAGRSAGERGSLLQEQVRPRLHGGRGERGPGVDRLRPPHPQGGARPRHRGSATGGDGLPGREHPLDLRLLRERPVDQRAVHDRRRREAGGRVQALRRHGGPAPSSPRASSSHARSRSWPGPSAVRSS